jgi:hypothetical protein
MRSISPEIYLSRSSRTLISSAGGSSAIGGIGVKGFFAIVQQRYGKSSIFAPELILTVYKKALKMYYVSIIKQ